MPTDTLLPLFYTRWHFKLNMHHHQHHHLTPPIYTASDGETLYSNLAVEKLRV